MIKIEHNVPIPGRLNDKGFTQTMRKLNIGDSFMIDKDHRDGAYGAARTVQIKICIRRVDDEKVRVWRVK